MPITIPSVPDYPRAIIEVFEVAQGRSGSFAHTREREYTRTFTVITTDERIDPLQIRLATGIPRLWQPYISAAGTFDLGVLCTDVHPRQRVDDPLIWDVEVKYSNKIQRPDINQIENPLLRPPEVSWGDESVAAPAEFDRNGDPITNSAGDPFDPPPEVFDTRLVLTIVRNQIAYDPAYYAMFRNTVNGTPFLGLHPGRWLCRTIPATRQFENGILYWKVTFTFVARWRHDELTSEHDPKLLAEDAWADKILDRGVRQLERQGGVLNRVPIILPGGMIPTTTPVMLDGNGYVLPVDGEPVYRIFYKYPPRDFNELLLF